MLNGPLETSLRLLMILDVEYPNAHDIDDLLVFDHLSLHTGDIDGPSSLHPALPLRAADLGARREQIRSGVEMLLHRQLADVVLNGESVAFVASEDSKHVTDLFESPYLLALKDRVHWVHENRLLDGPSATTEALKNIVTSWTEELGGDIDAID